MKGSKHMSTFWTPQNDKNPDLEVSEDFKILNLLAPPPFEKNEKNADFDVSEDFKILHFLDPPKHRFG